MIRDVINDVNELSYKSKEIDIKDRERVECIYTDLKDTLSSLENRFYLTAKEIGFEERAIAMKFSSDDGIVVMFNPAINSSGNVIINREINVIDSKEYFVPRNNSLTVTFQIGDNGMTFGDIKSYKLSDSASCVFGQAYDLLNGLLVSDYGLEVLPEFDEASEEEKEEVLEMYINSLSELHKSLDEDLSKDEELSKVWEHSKFINAVNSGKIELEEKPLSNRKARRLKRLLKSIGKKVKI